MSFGNRRPGVPVKPPAVARHVAVRLLDHESPRWIALSAAESKRRWEKLLTSLTEHVVAVKTAYGDARPVRFVRPEEGFVTGSDIYCVRGSCIVPVEGAEQREGFRLRLRVDMHKEICSITYLFDHIGREGQSGSALPDAIARLPDDLAAFDYLIDGMWEDGGGSEVAVAAVPWLAGGGFGPPGEKFGRKLVDFRSVILHADPLTFSADTPAKEPFAARAPVSVELLPAIAEFASRHAPLILKAAGADSHWPGGGEPIVCGMLDGAALYASRLGRWRAQDSEIEPIRHLLVYAGDSGEQLGRLVRRMHLLGQLRHAALMDFAYDEIAAVDQDVPMPALRRASEEMRRLGQELTDESSQLASPSDLPVLEGAIPRLVEINNSVPGGLTYRVERARRYSSDFRNTIEHLRTVKLRHWVAYDDFARRHILNLLDRVDHLGHRYEALSERVQRLLSFRYTMTVQKELRIIDSATNALKDSANDQRKLLRYAHLFAIMFSVYYVGTVFDHLYEIRGPLHIFPHWLYYSLWAIFMTYAVVKAIWEMWRSDKTKSEVEEASPIEPTVQRQTEPHPAG
jgi:hypothetical protein